MNAISKPQLPLLELDLLKTVIAIAETGNFSSAAEAVFRTPSAVSMQVKKIEELLERPIFERDSRSVKLTADGEVLLAHARRVLALNREIVAQFVAPHVSGVVRMGAPDDAAERMLPKMLSNFAKSHPNITVDVVVDQSVNLVKRVKSKQIDMTIITCAGVLRDEPNVEILTKERLVWAGLKGGIAHEKRPLPVSVWEEGCVWRRNGLKTLETSGIDYRIAFQSSNISGQRAAILADLVVAPIPVSSLGGQIVEAEIEGLTCKMDEYGLGLLVAENPSEPVSAAVDHLRASF